MFPKIGAPRHVLMLTLQAKEDPDAEGSNVLAAQEEGAIFQQDSR